MRGLIHTLLALPLSRRFARDNRSFALWRRTQDEYVRRIVARAFAVSAFYRSAWSEVGVDPGSIRGLEDLARLPVVERDAWRRALREDLAARPPSARLVWHPTGGTSGAPFRMPYTPADDVRLRATVLAVMRAHGARWSQRALWLLPPDTHSRGGRRMLGRVRLVDSDATTEERLAALATGSEPVLRGYPWPVWRAVVAARRRGLSLPPRRLFVTGGEPLPDSVRSTLEQGLGARVVSRYAATDFGQMAAECGAGSLHACVGAHAEILDGDRPAAPGRDGDVVATNFFSRAGPLIRVRTGDRAAWGEGPCRCGSGVPYLAHVSGRTEDCIRTPGGQVIRFVDMEPALAELGPALWGFQAEQTGPDRVLVRLSTSAPAGGTGTLAARLERLFAGMRVSVDLTDDLVAEGNGKTRVCRAEERTAAPAG